MLRIDESNAVSVEEMGMGAARERGASFSLQTLSSSRFVLRHLGFISQTYAVNVTFRLVPVSSASEWAYARRLLHDSG
jgi:hypothetical protein